MASRRLQLVLNLDTGGYTGTLGRAASDMRRFSGTVDNANRTLAKSGKNFTDLGRVAHRPLDALREGVLVFGNLRLAALALSGTLGVLVGGMVKQSAEIERMTVLMKGLSDATTEAGRAAEAQKNINALFDMSRRNGVAVKDLTDAFVKMKSGGVDPMRGSLENLTDAVAAFGGTSQVMHRASIAIQQMAGKGVISMEELRQQLGEAVPTAMSDMARAMGMPLKEFTKLVGDGKVQAKPALELMFREFELLYSGAGERMAQTLSGQWQVFQTNLTQMSTIFTGQMRADIDEQTKLYEEGKISWAQYKEALEPVEGGLFAELTKGLKDINAAMNTNEARASMASLGQSIGTIAGALASMIRTAIEWRSEIWTGIKVIATGFALLKTIQIAKWIGDFGLTAVASLKNVAGASNFAGNSLLNLASYTERAGRAAELAAQRQANHLNIARATVSTQNQKISALAAESTRLQALAGDYTRNIGILERQRAEQVKQVNTARTLHQANLQAGRSGTASLAALSQASANLNRTNQALITTKRQLATTNRAVAATEAALTVAANTQTAAMARGNVIVGQGTLALRAKAAAATVATAAVRGLGIAVNIALGPIGAIVGVLLSAAWAAGVFEKAADRAAAAAARMAQGIATAEDVKEGIERRKNNKTTIERGTAALQRSGDLNADGTLKSTANINERRLYDRIQEAKKENRRLDTLIESSTYTLKRQSREQFADRWMTNRDEHRQKNSARFDDATARFKRGEISQADLDRERDRAQKSNQLWDTTAIDKWREKAEQARKRGDTELAAYADAAAKRLEEARSASQDLSVATADLREQSVGAGKAMDGAGGKAKKMSAEQKAAAAAVERYNDMLANQAGEIARLEEESIGAEGALAKFNAQVKAGKFDDATTEQLAKMAANMAKIDELNEKISYNQSISGLSKSIAKAGAENDQLWKSLAKGTWDADLRLAQTRMQFEHLLDGITNPEKRAEVQAMIDKLVGLRQSADAADIARGWEEATQDILVSLMTEDEAREANYIREIERQRSLIDWSKLSAEERAKAEQRFQELRWAMARKYERDSENGTVKMLRDWTNLGAGIDRAMTGALDGFVDGLAEGKMQFGKFAKQILLELMKVILRAMIAYAILSALGMTNGMSMGSFMKQQVGNWAGGFSPQAPNVPAGSPGFGTVNPSDRWSMPTPYSTPPIHDPKYHTGGWIGRMALKPGEVPMIGQEGEVVLNKQQQAFYADKMAGAGAPAVPNIEINMINNSGTPVSAEQGESRFDAGKMIVDVVVDALGKQGPLRDGIERLKGNG